jgi:chromosomal replication initiator protein
MKSFKEVFEAVKLHLESQVSEQAANLWIKPLQFVDFDDETMIIDCGDNFVKNIVISKYADAWQKAFNEVFGFDINITFINSDERSVYITNSEKENHTVKIDPERETFDNFVVGPSNKFAHAAACAVAANPGNNSISGGINYNPLFIYGNSGLGKTHLLNAIANEIKDKDPNINIVFVHAEEFTNDFIQHLSNKTTSLFHEKYRNADILIVDDIQFLAGKIQTQEEFFHTINNYIINDKQIILSSDRPPKDIQTLADRIRNRIEAGLLADIQPPELETRIAIINHKCKSYGLELNEDIVIFIAEKVKNNIRQLEGVVKKISAYKNLDPDMQITIGEVQSIIKDIITSNQPVPQLTEKIIFEVSRNYNVSIDDLLSKKRDTNISNPRQIAMYIIRNVTDMTFQEIGAKFDRHYATVIHSIQNVEDRIKFDSSLKAQISDIIKNVKDE